MRAGQEAERLAAPAEAHRHFDQALALWDRVNEPEKLAGVDRGWLAYDSAENTAGRGDVARAVAELRRLRATWTPQADPVLVNRVGERLAYFLLSRRGNRAAAGRPGGGRRAARRTRRAGSGPARWPPTRRP